MTNSNSDLPPPMRLAIAYAGPDHREVLALTLRLDARIAQIATRATEPLIAQMKLAWWREAIAAQASARPRGEPMLAELTAMADPIVDAALQQILNAWEELLADEDWRPDTLESFAGQRGNAIFLNYAKRVGAAHEDVAALGAQWATGDLRARTSRLPKSFDEGSQIELPRDRRLRPLTIMALSVRMSSGPRLLWHALTGR